MPRTLRTGSTGPDVAEFQNGLNRLPTKLPPLDTDGIFGMRTHTRVRELQGAHQLTSDGIVGPMTWELFTRLLAAIQNGTLPTVPAGAFDLMRPLVLTVAQQHLGAVDFSVMQGGRPKGLDFLIQLFRESANVPLTDANFRDEKGAWIWTPWVGLKHQRKSWCGIFAVWCYRKAGIPVRWDIGIGGPVGPVRINSFSPQFVANIKQADMGCVATKSHHFLIESVDGGGPLPRLTTIDANTTWGRIVRTSSSSGDAHKVGKDNFNYYSLG